MEVIAWLPALLVFIVWLWSGMWAFKASHYTQLQLSLPSL